ncbi:phasin family protein [Longimicrobium sp.]|uniref:phasin family protein n=1 Tax=Longimicrobium sp. TaxID=2029185 RepID=UPI002CC1D65C|nr:phasin family protein [Longimicrobium sp.]HSU15369.1 phasin family protein [Longimicrobium sp.]
MSTNGTKGGAGILRLGDLPKNVADRVVKLPREIAEGVTTRGRDVWLAGLGALAAAEDRGSAFYGSLVKQGEELVKRGETVETRGKARWSELKDDVGTRQEAVVEKVESTIVDPVVDALRKLGVPTRAEVQTLSTQVESLTERVNLLIAKLERRHGTVFSVVFRAGEWAVEKSGTTAPLSVHASEADALEAARLLAVESRPCEVVIHREDGSVQNTVVYDA